MRFDGSGNSLRRAASAAASEALRSFIKDGAGLADRLRAAAGRVAGLRGLAPALRDALWLVDGLGFTVREAAELAGCDEVSLERRLAEARRSIAGGRGHAL